MRYRPDQVICVWVAIGCVAAHWGGLREYVAGEVLADFGFVGARFEPKVGVKGVDRRESAVGPTGGTRTSIFRSSPRVPAACAEGRHGFGDLRWLRVAESPWVASEGLSTSLLSIARRVRVRQPLKPKPTAQTIGPDQASKRWRGRARDPSTRDMLQSG